jgi:hypothetical protein
MKILLRSNWARYWNQFWFAPTSPRNLAGARIIFSFYSLWVLASRNLPEVSGLPSDFWSRVDATARWRYLDFPGHLTLERILVWVAGIALVCAGLGWFSRLACFVSGILLYHLGPLESIIWIPHPYARGLTISVLALLTLAFRHAVTAGVCSRRASAARELPVTTPGRCALSRCFWCKFTSLLVTRKSSLSVGSGHRPQTSGAGYSIATNRTRSQCFIPWGCGLRIDRRSV